MSAVVMSVKTYRCGDCSATFDTDEDLLQHLTEPYSIFSFQRCKRACFYCHGIYGSPRDLKLHMEESHSCFQCVRCYLKFYLRAQYDRHMSTHLPSNQNALQIYLPGMMFRETFNRFAQRLRPDRDFYSTCDDIKQRIERFMQYNSSYRRCRILKAGSIGKETDIKSQADVDLILFLDGYNSVADYSRSVDSIIDRLQRHIEHGDMNWAIRTEFQRRTPFSVQFELTFGREEVKMPIDLLPAVNVLSGTSRNSRESLYTQMKMMSPNMRNYYSSCLSDLQVEFVKAIPSDLKDVIRVIKHWAKRVKQEEYCNTVRSYFCELLVISTWMDKGSPRYINTANYVKEVMCKMSCCPSIRIVWPGQYDFHKFETEMDRPMVLDPANPYRNIAPSRRDAATISRCALELLDDSVKKKYKEVIGAPDSPEDSPSLAWKAFKGVCVAAALVGFMGIAGSKS